MRLTAFTDFGLRALMRMAGAPSVWVTADNIAREFGVSRHHLSKVVLELAGAGLIETRRGAQGGMRLARSAKTISLGEIVRTLEARYALVECFAKDGGACVLTPACKLKGKLAAAQEAFLQELDKTSLASCAIKEESITA